MKRIMAVALASGLGLSACSSLTNEDVGTVSGAAIGGILGSTIGSGSGQVAAAAAGVLAGAYLGGQIGRTMDRQDKVEMQRALETAKTGSAVHWSNPDRHIRYTIKPTKTYYREDRPCRDYTTVAYFEGKRHTVHGRACRDSRGHWVATN